MDDDEAEDDVYVNSADGMSLFRSSNADKGIEFSDPSDFQGNVLHQYIEFYSLPADKAIRFKAFLTDFTDSYKSDWNKENLFGRMDPLQTFKGTERTITISWDVPSASLREAKANLKRASILFSMLYPAYSQGPGAVMTTPPLFKLKMMNWIHDAGASAQNGAGSAKECGLIGTASGFDFAPDLEAGVFHDGPGKIYPKAIKLNCTYTVNHTHIVGWGSNGTSYDDANTFPYGEVSSRPTIHQAAQIVNSGGTAPDGGDTAIDQAQEVGTPEALEGTDARRETDASAAEAEAVIMALGCGRIMTCPD